MSWDTNIYALILLAAGLMALGTATFGWLRRRCPGGWALTAVMAVVAWWCFCGFIEASVISPAAKILAAKLQYVSIVSLAPLWLLFALAHGRRLARVPQRTLAALWLVPIVILVLALSNERHGLVWTSIEPVSEQPGALLVYGHGPAVWGNFVFAYALVLLATLILVRDALRLSGVFRKQTTWLLAGAAFPWLGNAVYMLRLGPPGVDLTPVAFTFGGACLAVSLLRYRLLDVVPIAHDELFARMTDSVLVMDLEHRVLDLNPAARRLIGAPADVVGRSLIDLLAPWPDFAALAPGLLGRGEGDVIRCPELGRWLDVRISELRDARGKANGRLLVLRDVSASKAAEEERYASLERIGRQQQAVVALAVHPAVTAGDLPAAAAALTEAAGATMDVERTSVWLGSFEEGRLCCLDLYQKTPAGHDAGALLEPARYPRYFEAVRAGRAIDAGDAAADPRTSEFRDDYLTPFGIGSMLDAPIRAGGRVRGIICFEHVGPLRVWRSDEIRFAGEVADMAAQALLNAERREAAAALHRREEMLSRSVREKEVLLKEVHHRVRNNMQVISSLLSLQARAAAEPALREAFRASQDRIKALALVHEKLYRSADLARIDFADYAQSLVVHLLNMAGAEAGRIRFVARLEPLELDIGLSIPLGLVVNELVGNALRHGFPEGRGGTIEVCLERIEGGRARLAVRDDGVGWPDGLEPGDSRSLGLQIVRTLADQIDGVLGFEGDAGVAASVVFPLPA